VHSIRGGQSLAVARELWEARDRYAREIDTAPGRLVPDSSLVAAAKALPATRHELAALREFSGRASRSELSRWWAAIEAGMAAEDTPVLRVPGDVIPPPRAWSERNPEADRRLKLARTAVGEIAGERSIPVENLLTPELLRRVSWSPPQPLDEPALRSVLADLGARDWQLDETVQAILDAFVEASQPVEHADDAVS
jgi:ribonuclease D